jgi:DNA polymerase III psi subunit
VSSSAVPHLFQEELYQIPAPVIVVLSQSWTSYPESEKTLLSKILGSVKIDLASVRVITRKSFSIADLPPDQPTRVLVFGSETTDIPPYHPMQAQGFTVVKADDLMQLDDARKKSLWGALKQMFNA